MVKLSAPVAVFGMILFGTSCSLLAKLIYSVNAPDIYGNTSRYEKPWFQVLAMFGGMSVCILLDLPKPYRFGTSSESQPLLANAPSQPSQASIWIISIPTLFDLFATACGTTGLLYTNVSVYQMLRGAMLVWTAILSIIFLKRRLTALNYAGIFFCVMGIALVGMANVWSEDSPKSRKDIVFGILIILLGQVLQAAQVVIEEFLLQDLQMSSVRVVAWEGLFGIMHCVLWVFPILYLLPGRDHGHLEDALDAVYMMTHSWTVAALIFTDMILMLFYNVCGMEVTDALSAVHRVVIETLRTLCVWVIDLMIYYIFSGGRLGEKWTAYSFLQLAGFILLVTGTILYNYENLLADYEKRKKTRAIETPAAHLVPATEYESLPTPFKPDEKVSKPVAMQMAEFEDEEDEEEEENAGSFYGHTVGSVAHSPFLVATSATPTSFSGSLRHRSGFQASP